ncbi:MAG: leucine-rich repeat protein [Eubacteriales bacterium]|nr:leucine-rich repeat protein [Eubacteriales bacterium]
MKSTLFIAALLLGLLFAVCASADTEYTEGAYNYTVTDGKAKIIKCSGYLRGPVVIPSTLGGYPVTAIGEKAFKVQVFITSIVIPEGVEVLEAYAFDGCMFAANISLPGSITDIRTGAFRGCHELKSINIPANVGSIGEKAFSLCVKLTDVTYHGKTQPQHGANVFEDAPVAQVNVPVGYRAGTFCGMPVLCSLPDCAGTDANSAHGHTLAPCGEQHYTCQPGHDAAQHTKCAICGYCMSDSGKCTCYYTVAVAPGAGMSKTADSGPAKQWVVKKDAMTAVVYTADEEHYFPEDYSAAAVNGVSVTRNGFTQITVSGTPTEDTALTLPAATAKQQKETVPAAVFTADGDDTGALSNVAVGMQYKINDGEWIAVSSERVELSGLNACTISVVKKGGETTLDSDVQTIAVTKAAAPAGVTTANCTTVENNNGALQGVTAAMEYKKNDAQAWTACADSAVTGLHPGDYDIRVKAGGTALASDTVRLSIDGFIAVTGIDGVPDSAVEGTTVELTGTVTPDNATYKTIVWSVQDAGTTGASVYGNILFVPAEGTVVVTAAIENGAGQGTAYTENFTITVIPALTVSVTDTENGTVLASPPFGVSGTEITLTAVPHSEHHFKGWNVLSGGVTIQNNKFTLGTSDVEIQAVLEACADGEDSDHACDVCDGAIASEVCFDRAGDGDHACDECGEKIDEGNKELCIDKDADGFCDECGSAFDTPAPTAAPKYEIKVDGKSGAITRTNETSVVYEDMYVRFSVGYDLGGTAYAVVACVDVEWAEGREGAAGAFTVPRIQGAGTCTGESYIVTTNANADELTVVAAMKDAFGVLIR